MFIDVHKKKMEFLNISHTELNLIKKEIASMLLFYLFK